MHRVHENLLHENGLPHTSSEWYERRVYENLLHRNEHHVHKNLQVMCFCCTWFNMAERQEGWLEEESTTEQETPEQRKTR